MKDLIKNYEEKIPRKLLEEFDKEVEEKKITKKHAEEALEDIKKKYEHAKISPGEAIGIITAESFGEPSTQMSIQKDEKIIVKIDDKIKIIEIGKFVDGLIGLKGSLNINEDSEILPLNDLEMYVPSLNQEEKVEWKRVIECSRHKPNKKLMKIITASGREITSTDNHSFVTRVNNSVVPIKGTELKIGNRIPVVQYLPVENSKMIDVKEFMQEDYIFENEDGDLESKYNAKKIPGTIELNKKTGWFIGAYLSEGSSNSGSVNILNINDNYMNNAKIFVNGIGLDYKEDFYHRGFAESRDLKINSSLLARFVIGSCGQGSSFKHVPDFAYNASNEFVSGLLRGYFDGDGNFHVDKKMIRASSNSKELIDGIALLLSRFKIFSFKIKDKRGQYWLLIPYKYAPLFLLNIGSDIEHKRTALEKLAEKSKEFWNEKSVDYTDIISGFGDLFYKAAKKLNYPTRYINNFTKRQKIGRTALFRYIKIFEELAEKKNINIKEEIGIMNRMFNSDIVWDEIVKIEHVEHKHEYVYDLSVPGLETFTTAEGIITHNTLNVFHLAGVAEVNVTVGLPRLIEIFDARKDISTPLMEIYIDKEHNKDIKEVRKIAAQIKETRLAEVVSEFSINLAALQIEIEVDKKRLQDIGVTEKTLVEILTKNLKDVSVRSGNKIVLKPKSNENELLELYKLKEKAKEIFIRGVKGITQVLPIKKDNEFIIITYGSNLKDVLEIKEVDATKTITNDIYEVLSVLGIEAARQIIINESNKVIEDQGLDVDIRHILFISDVMTTTGEIRGITRSGITGEKESVLARASFETPVKHIINASLLGERDQLNSVIENVMVNQPVPLGTGLPDLVAKMKKEEKKK